MKKFFFVAACLLFYSATESMAKDYEFSIPMHRFVRLNSVIACPAADVNQCVIRVTVDDDHGGVITGISVGGAKVENPSSSHDPEVVVEQVANILENDGELHIEE